MAAFASYGSRQFLACLLAVTMGGPSWAETDDDKDYSLGVTHAAPGSEQTMVESGTATFSGNPAKSAFSWWPKDLVVAPVPGYSPEIGWNIAVAGGYFLDLDGTDKKAPASLIGGGAMTSENGSSALGLGGKFHLLGDRLRVEAALAGLELNYRFWGVGSDAGSQGNAIDIPQDGSLAYVAAKWQVRPNLYVGAGYLAGDTVVAPRNAEQIAPELPDPELDIELAAIQVPVDYDTRDDEYFPRSGWKVSGRAYVYSEDVGSDFDATVVTLAVNKYITMRDRDVLAMRAFWQSSGNRNRENSMRKLLTITRFLY